MKTFVALLRGINVGGHNRLPMKGLVAVLDSLGAASIESYLQSGNVVFQNRRGHAWLSEALAIAIHGVGRSRLAAASETAIGVPMTDRNWGNGA